MITSIPLPPLPPDSPFTSPEYIKATQQLLTTRDQGRPADWKYTQQWAMSSAHTIFINLLLRVYALADWAVEHDDLANYLGFAGIAFAQLHSHHHFEEDFFFPFVEKAIEGYAADPRLAPNVAEHRFFDKQLADAWVYVQSCRDALTPKPKASPIRPPQEMYNVASPYYIDPAGGFSAAKLRAQMDGWIVTLVEHLAAEIGTLEPEWIGSMGKKKHDAMEKLVGKHLQELDPTWFLTSALGTVPNKLSRQLIPLPMPVRRGLVPLLWSGKYWGYWKYLEYPQQLTIMGSG